MRATELAASHQLPLIPACQSYGASVPGDLTELVGNPAYVGFGLCCI